jgi:hypothetical protein
MTRHDLAAVAREIIDTNAYMTLATADEHGQPWASPVFYWVDGYTDFYWMSATDVVHSRNVAVRPRVSIVIFDSRAAEGTAVPVYMSALAEQVADADVERAVAFFPGPGPRGGCPVSAAELRAPAPYRLYRASVTETSMLCPRGSAPCVEHGRAYDHRTAVTL